MSAQLIDGKQFANHLKEQVAEGVAQRLRQKHPAPVLAVVLVGNNPASHVYVKHKQIACTQTGIVSKRIELPDDTSEQALLHVIETLNHDPNVHGILVQLPLPPHISLQKAITTVAPEKDVDGFHPQTLPKMARGEAVFHPCTPYGIMQMLRYLGIALKGKTAVVVGHSIIVGQPMEIELSLAGCQVIVCDSNTLDLEAEVKKGDIVVVAVGKPNVVAGAWIKPKAVVIDVGINRLSDGKLVGDVEFEVARQRASYITPVPGGVGPITVAVLMQNTLQAAEQQSANTSFI